MEKCKDEYNCAVCSRTSAMFNMLSDEELQMIAENRVYVRFKAGEVIQKQGAFMSHVISVNSGLVKVYLEREGRKNTILRIVKPSNFIGGPGIYYDQMHHYTVSAMIESSVCFIDLLVFKNILNQNKAFAVAFMKDFSEKVISVYNRLLSLTNKQLAGRMAYTLLYLFEEVFEKSERSITFSRQDLADLSEISVDSARKIVRDFQKEGLIKITNNDLELLNPEAIRMIWLKG
jgi:CRP/FNR family transcriptional regulator